MSRARLAAGLAAAALLLTGLPSAIAQPSLATAQQRAAELRAGARRLEIQAEQAIETYNEAQGLLGEAVQRHLEAEEAARSAHELARHSGRQVNDRVRALYMSGGGASLYASVLDASDLHDALARYVNVSSIVNGSRKVLDEASVQVKAADVAVAKARAASRAQGQLQRQIDVATAAINEALAKQQALLASADAEVAALLADTSQSFEVVGHGDFAAAWAAAKGYPAEEAAARLAADPTTVSPLMGSVIDVMRQQLGKPYQWGATGPNSFDCSGLIGYAFSARGVTVPRTSRQLWRAGSHPGLAGLRAGDLLFWGSQPGNVQSIHHVTTYLGGGMMIAAPRTGDVVKIQPVYLDDFYGVTRLVPSMAAVVPGPQMRAA